MGSRLRKCSQCKWRSVFDVQKGSKPICVVCRYRNGLEKAVEHYRAGIQRAADNYRMSLPRFQPFNDQLRRNANGRKRRQRERGKAST